MAIPSDLQISAMESTETRSTAAQRAGGGLYNQFNTCHVMDSKSILFHPLEQRSKQNENHQEYVSTLQEVKRMRKHQQSSLDQVAKLFIED